MKELRSIAKLIDSFQRLPGIGHKTAEKMAYQVLEMKGENVEYFADALKEVKEKCTTVPFVAHTLKTISARYVRMICAIGPK